MKRSELLKYRSWLENFYDKNTDAISRRIVTEQISDIDWRLETNPPRDYENGIPPSQIKASDSSLSKRKKTAEPTTQVS